MSCIASIAGRQYVLNSEWGDVRPRADEENAFLERHSWEEYAQWRPGLTEGAADETKRRYAFVYGDLRRLHPSGLIACVSAPPSGATRRWSSPRTNFCSCSTRRGPRQIAAGMISASWNGEARSCGPLRDGARRARTADLLGAIQALSQLSYSPAEGSV